MGQEMIMKFSVAAGKYDDHERNCKYCENFDDLDKAIVAYYSVSDYPWAELIYHGKDHTHFVMNPYIES